MKFSRNFRIANIRYTSITLLSSSHMETPTVLFSHDQMNMISHAHCAEFAEICPIPLLVCMFLPLCHPFGNYHKSYLKTLAPKTPNESEKKKMLHFKRKMFVVDTNRHGKFSAIGYYVCISLILALYISRVVVE